MASNCTFTSLLSLSLSTLFFILTSSSSEPDTLLTFKSSISDPMNHLSTWSNTISIHHCNWTGVTCTSTPPLSVASLNLQSFNLSGQISPSICQLSNLSYLNLADNLFNEPIPLHLSLCGSLETLNLSNNLIWGTIPDQISDFGSLRVLDFSKNHVEGKIPESIGSLKNLEVLNFGSNLLSGENAFHSSLELESASSCYVAPEFGYAKKATEQMDTYSFGVVLLELVTGRPADQTGSGEDSIDVVKWVRRKINITNGASQVLDPKISDSSKHEALRALEIALQCTSVVPEKRPPMCEVVRALRSLG